MKLAYRSHPQLPSGIEKSSYFQLEMLSLMTFCETKFLMIFLYWAMYSIVTVSNLVFEVSALISLENVKCNDCYL